MKSPWHQLIAVLILALSATITSVTAQDDCGVKVNFNASNYQEASIQTGLAKWQGIVLILGFGAFGLVMALLSRLVRRFIYCDGHMLDTFFDAGSDVNFGLVACVVITQWLWTSSYSYSTTNVMQYGLVGHYWHAAAGFVHPVIFSILAYEMRTKAPGAKTFLQVICSRFGKGAHVIMIIFALFVNFCIAGMVLTEGTRILTSLCEGIDKEAICILIVVVVGLYTVVGGVGGNVYMSFFSCALIIAITLVYYTKVFYNVDMYPNGSKDIYDKVCGVESIEGNKDMKLLTFFSRGGLIEGIVFILCGFSSSVLNQSFYTTAVIAKPTHAVWGYITGAVAWFGIPFMLAFTFGMTYWGMAASNGGHVVSYEQAMMGYLPVYMSQRLLGTTGDFMMYALTLAVVITLCSSEILSISSIITYDIYQPYIYPFRLMVHNDGCANKGAEQEAFLEYNRKTIIINIILVTFISILLFPVALLLLAIGIDLPWLFKFLGVVCGSCVFPTLLTFSSHRLTRSGLISGVILGFLAGFISWLVYASTFDGGLTMFRHNTGRQEVFLVGAAVSMGTSLLVTLIISLATGGFRRGESRSAAWDSCRMVDNPVMPWAVHYAPECGTGDTCERPHVKIVRKSFRCSQLSAYILGILLSVGVVIIWPGLMLIITDIFDYPTFKAWTGFVLLWAAFSATFICVIGLIYELLQLCCQAYANSSMEREEENNNQPVIVQPGQLIKPAPVYDPQPGCGAATCYHNQLADPTIARSAGGMSMAKRWQTSIRIQ